MPAGWHQDGVMIGRACICVVQTELFLEKSISEPALYLCCKSFVSSMAYGWPLPSGAGGLLREGFAGSLQRGALFWSKGGLVRRPAFRDVRPVQACGARFLVGERWLLAGGRFFSCGAGVLPAPVDLMIIPRLPGMLFGWRLAAGGWRLVAGAGAGAGGRCRYWLLAPIPVRAADACA